MEYCVLSQRESNAFIEAVFIPVDLIWDLAV